MQKSIKTFLIFHALVSLLFAAPALELKIFKGGSNGNGGDFLRTRTQLIAKQKLLPLIALPANATLFSETEKVTLRKIIEGELPLLIVSPIKLARDRYIPIGKETFSIEELSFTENGVSVPAVVAQDTQTGNVMILIDESTWGPDTAYGTRFTRTYLRSLLRLVVRYAYATEQISRDDLHREISNAFQFPVME